MTARLTVEGPEGDSKVSRASPSRPGRDLRPTHVSLLEDPLATYGLLGRLSWDAS